MSAAATQALPETESLNIQASEEEIITDKFEVLEARALELYARDQDSALELGKALIAVRDSLKDIHGAFTAWYRDHDLDENRVHYCIRKMEGKITPSKKRAVTSLEMPEADFMLNKHNLHVANFAPSSDGKHSTACVRVDGNGTTATDGFVVVQVSLPMGQPESTRRAEGNMPRGLVLRAARQGENLYCVTLGDTSTVIATPSCAVQGDAPLDYFPPYEKVIPKEPPIAEIFIKDYENVPGSLSRLIELLSFARDFNPLGVVKLSCHQNGLLWLDCEPGPYGQRLRGGIQPITTEPPALPPAPESNSSPQEARKEAARVKRMAKVALDKAFDEINALEAATDALPEEDVEGRASAAKKVEDSEQRLNKCMDEWNLASANFDKLDAAVKAEENTTPEEEKGEDANDEKRVA